MSPLERRLLDEVEIQRLPAYSHACMRLDGTAAAATYAEDGVLAAFYKPEIVGRAAIAAALVATLAPLEFLAQSCTAGIIDVEGDAATATWTVVELLRGRGDDAPSCCFGSYEDRLTRTAKGWRFAHRRFLPFYRGGLGGGKGYGEPGFERPLGDWPPHRLA